MTLERRYGVSLRPLAQFCERVYGASDKKAMHQALSVLGFKLEGRIIMRHPGYEMNDRLMLYRINYEDWTVELDSGVYPLNTHDFPTVDPADPYRLTDEEQELVDEYVSASRRASPCAGTSTSSTRRAAPTCAATATCSTTAAFP